MSRACWRSKRRENKMSYILEALKKSQAERQLGSAPTLHAVPVGAAPADAAAGQRWPLWLGLAGGAAARRAGGNRWPARVGLAGGALAVAPGVQAGHAQAPAVKPPAPKVAV